MLAQPMHDAPQNPANSGPQGSVQIAADGSMAAFVPAQRALTWHLIDSSRNSVVKERYWVTFQPGEIRVCTSCHGINTEDQAGHPAPTNPPQALTALLKYYQNSLQTARAGQHSDASPDSDCDALAVLALLALPPTPLATATPRATVPPASTQSPTPTSAPVVENAVHPKVSLHVAQMASTRFAR